ncbi:hypothetical protein LH67_20950 [Xenorhabdus nematophila]|nr:hypothetical protein LH67_20950 [Xenorhabdus nematophila]
MDVKICRIDVDCINTTECNQHAFWLAIIVYILLLGVMNNGRDNFVITQFVMEFFNISFYAMKILNECFFCMAKIDIEVTPHPK